jgi:hypothetical protein
MDFIADGQPWEAPDEAANQAYAATSPGVGAALGSQAMSAIGSLGRWLQESLYEPEGIGARIGRSLMQSSEIEGGVPPEERVIGPDLAPLPGENLPAAEIDKRYAPIGNDGKPVSIANGRDMPDKLGSLLGDAKRQEIERNNIWSRYAGAHSWPTNFAVGALGFMLDPLNAATLFMPGLGEEAVLSGAARLGFPATGALARVGARGIAGAVTGAAAQAPIAGLRYGLGLEENSDYGLREAFWDLAANAAGGAIMHAGFGALADLARGRGVAPPEVAPPAEAAPRALTPELRAEAEPLLAADAVTKHEALRAAVSQELDGRPVDVKPFFPEPPSPAARSEVISSDDFRRSIAAHGGDMGKASDTLVARVQEALEAGQPVKYVVEGREIPIASVERGMMADAQGLRWGTISLAQPRAGEAAGTRIEIGGRPDVTNVPDIAAQQRALHADGFVPGMAQSELRAGMQEAYGGPPAEEAPPRGAAPGATPGATPPVAEAARPPEAGRAGAAPPSGAAEPDHELAEAERQLAATGEARLLPEEREELAASAAAMERVEGENSVLAQAAECIARGGLA